MQLVDTAAGSATLGFKTTIFTGEPDEYGAVPLANDLAAHGTRSVVVRSWWEESRAYFLEHLESGISLEGSRPLEGGYWGYNAYAGDALLGPGASFISVVSSNLSVGIANLSISGTGQRPLETEAGWLVPTIGGCVGPNELYRLNADLSAVEEIGETELSCAFENNDGARQLAVYEDEIFVANGLGGVLRGAWTPDDWISVQGPSTLTPQLWQEYVGADGSGSIRVERDEDILFVSGQWSTSLGEWHKRSIGVVRICPL